MDQIIQYFENISSGHRSLILFGGLTLFLLLESGVPLFQFKNSKWKHLGLNLFFTFTTILVNFVLAFLLISSCVYVTNNDIGLLNLFDLPLGIYAFSGILLMDLISAWLAHFVFHKTKWLWQFHIIHHTDTTVDASTANRHHPGESVLRFGFTCLAVWIVGAPVWMLMIYQAMSAFLSQFNHSNIKMPKFLDDILMLVICTPNMHRVHHHYRQPYSDSNYGNIFSFWDRMFGTFKKVDNKHLKYGLDTHMNDPEVGNIWALLKIPFAGYRPEIEYENEEKFK